MSSRVESGDRDPEGSSRPGTAAWIEAFIVPLLVGGALPIILLLTWSPEGARTRGAIAIREYAIPVLAIEGLVIALAFVRGLRPWLMAQRVPRLVMACLAIWIVIAWATGILVARRTDVSVFLTVVWMAHLLFGISMAFLVSAGKVTARALAASIMAGFGVYALAMAVFALQLDDPDHFNWLTGIPGIGNIRRVGGYASALLGLCLGGLALRSDRRLLPLAIACLGFFVAFWTGARGTVFAIVVGSLAAAIFFRPLRTWRLPVFAIVTAGIGLALTFVQPVAVGANGPANMLRDRGDDGRLDVWRHAVVAVKESPVYGYGEGQTAQVFPRPRGQGRHYAHAHNLLLQWLMAWGLIGAVCLLALSIWAGALLVRYATIEAMPFLTACSAQLAHAMIDGALYDLAPVLIFAACIGAASGLAMRESGTSAPE